MGEMVLPLTLVHDHHLGLGNNLDIEGALSGESWALVTQTANVQATLNKKGLIIGMALGQMETLRKEKVMVVQGYKTSKSQNWIKNTRYNLSSWSKNTRTNLSSWRNTSIQPGVAKGVELGTTLEEYQPFKELLESKVQESTSL
jgi:hypothetical protein